MLREKTLDYDSLGSTKIWLINYLVYVAFDGSPNSFAALTVFSISYYYIQLSNVLLGIGDATLPPLDEVEIH